MFVFRLAFAAFCLISSLSLGGSDPCDYRALTATGWANRFLINDVPSDLPSGKGLFESMANEADFANDLLKVIFDWNPVLERLDKPFGQLYSYKKTAPNFYKGFRNFLRDIRELGQLFPSKRFPLTKGPNASLFSEVNTHSSSKDLEDFGHKMKAAMVGRTVFDLANGHTGYTFAPRFLAHLFGAEKYIGVDVAHAPWWRTARNEYRAVSDRPDFRSLFYRDDLLHFLYRMERPGPAFYFMEGLEVVRDHDTEKQDPETHRLAQTYMEHVMVQLHALTHPGDAFMTGHVVSFLHPRSEMKDAWQDSAVDPGHFGFRRKATLKVNASKREDATIVPQYGLWIRE